MVRISISQDQPPLSDESLSAVFQRTGMSPDESLYYAEQTAQGHPFEIEAPDNEIVHSMIDSLRQLGVNLIVERD
ncbi:MAG: hypothetical protein KTR18_07175 [Acidiferrobacterales bacterium]|nr:hypothetical protein [Acidiferrobacterales bacterium]